MNDIIENITKNVDVFIKEDVDILNILKNTKKTDIKEYEIICSRISNKLQHLNDVYEIEKDITDKLYKFIIEYPDEKENCLKDVLNLVREELRKMDKLTVDMIYTRMMFIR